MERIELKTSVGTRVALGFMLAIVVLPLAVIGRGIGAVIAVVLVAGFIALCVAMGKRRLILDERGVTSRGIRSVAHVTWDEVDHYTFWSMDQQGSYAGVGGASGQGAIAAIIVLAVIGLARKFGKGGKNDHRRFSQGRLTLFTASGTKLRIDARYKGVAPVLDRVFAEVHPRLRARASDGLPTEFAPFTLTDTHLTHAKKGTLGLAEIVNIGAGSAYIKVKKRDKRLSWAAAPMKTVKNVMLFLEIAAERGLVVNANAEVFMPPSVVDKLRAAASRQSAMPQARVVAR